MGETTPDKLPFPDDEDAPDGPVQIGALAEATQAALTALMPTGTVLATARSSAPTGFLLCEGQSVKRTDYAALFSAIGTTYGSVDSTHFTLPDLRGRVPVGADGAAGRLSTKDALGDASGAEKVALTIGQLPSHTSSGASLNVFANAGIAEGAVRGGSGFPSGSVALGGGDSFGSNEPHSSMQPYQIVNYMIKV